MGRIPRVLQPKLQADLNMHRLLKVDLLDGSTLTSLPLPPPPRLKRRRNSDSTVCSAADDTIDENEEPIVLVEDYFPGAKNRRKLLASFKERIRPAEENELEQIFGKIPGTDMLKHCLLCDKPLYEISSLVPRTELACLYNDFVCSDCVCAYESFLLELYLAECKQESESERLIGILEEVRGPPRKFSKTLIGQLQSLRASRLELWLMELRRRLRWRWRLRGLLPWDFSRQ